MTNIIIGGVINNTSAAWLVEEMYNQGEELDFQEHCCHCPGKDDYHDDCWCENGQETWLLGFESCGSNDPDCWFREVGEFGSFGYKPDEDAEFSAIIGETYTQVVRSKWAVKSRMCSPCFPGQGDLDSWPYYFWWGHWAYCLPPDLFDEEIDGFDFGGLARIKPVKHIWLWDAIYFLGAMAQELIYM